MLSPNPYTSGVSEDWWGQHGTSGQVMEFTSTCLPQENMQPRLEWRLNVNSLDDLMFRIRLCELFLVNSSEMSLNDDLIVFSSYQWQINMRLVKDKRFILNLFYMLNKKKWKLSLSVFRCFPYEYNFAVKIKS